VFDTHFSERARELRLLRLLHQADAKLGIGVDETSVVPLIWLPVT
jgi:cyanophycinase-like exopeptidase